MTAGYSSDPETPPLGSASATENKTRIGFYNRKRDQFLFYVVETDPGLVENHLIATDGAAGLTTEPSMARMQLWLMSSVVRSLQTGMTAVTGQPESAPSGSHWENSMASGTRMD